MLGLSPFLVVLVAGFATTFLMPFLAIGAGLLIGLRWESSRWRSIIPCALAAGLAYPSGQFINLAILAQINGAWLQTLSLSGALKTAVMVSLLAAAFLAVGVWLSTLDGRNQRSDEAN